MLCYLHAPNLHTETSSGHRPPLSSSKLATLRPAKLRPCFGGEAGASGVVGRAHLQVCRLSATMHATQIPLDFESTTSSHSSPPSMATSARASFQDTPRLPGRLSRARHVFTHSKPHDNERSREHWCSRATASTQMWSYAGSLEAEHRFPGWLVPQAWFLASTNKREGKRNGQRVRAGARISCWRSRRGRAQCPPWHLETLDSNPGTARRRLL